MKRIIVLAILLAIVSHTFAGEGWKCKHVVHGQLGGLVSAGRRVYLQNHKSGIWVCIYMDKRISGGDHGFMLSLENGKYGKNLVGLAPGHDYNFPAGTLQYCKGYYYGGDTKFGSKTLQKYFGDRINLGDGRIEDIAFRVSKNNTKANVYIKHSKVTLGQAFSFDTRESLYPFVCLAEDATVTFTDLPDVEAQKISKTRDESTPRGSYKINEYYINDVSANLTCRHTLNVSTVYYNIKNAKEDRLLAEQIDIGYGNENVIGSISYSNNKLSYEKKSNETGHCINFINKMLKEEFQIIYQAVDRKFTSMTVTQVQEKPMSFQTESSFA